MNKSALKTFAMNARRELLKKVEAKAMKIGITEDNIKKADIESSDAIFIDGRQLSKEEMTQRDRLIGRIGQIGFKRVLEEVAYTWFNRFTALRFMEVNDYLPTKVRVLSSTNAGSTEPDMMKEALSLDLDLNMEYIYELKMNNKSEELFKYLIIKHCNDLNRYMPFMFETIDDYTEILFPEGLLATDSFVRYMTNTEDIPEDNWEEIEVIGWLYQYYIAEEKDRVFKEKKKYKAEEIPFATQLFTPDWIVRYMVQNSLGRYWVEAHPEHKELLNDWEFYLEHEQKEFQDKIDPYVNKELNVEDITCFDPAMGSGHILVYAFDVLYEIYSKCGYMEREIPRLIIEKNLYGLDIDDRAYQLACFSVVMKALKYNRRFLRNIEREGLNLNLASIQETNGWTDNDIEYVVGESSGEKFDSVKGFIEQYINGKTYGSLIRITNSDTAFLKDRLHTIKSTPVEDLFQTENREQVLSLLPKIIKQTLIMSKQYNVVILNPPYMGSGSMNKDLSSFLKKNYPHTKSDLFAAFMEIDHYLREDSFYAAINQHAWMFLSSFGKLREKIISNKFIDNMLHLGPRAFEEIGGEIVQSTAFVLRNTKIPSHKGLYLRLVDYRTARDKKERTIEAIQDLSVPFRYEFEQSNFSKIPGWPIAYWLLNTDIFDNEKLSETYCSGGRNKTHNNEKYIRYHWEVSNIGNKWVSYQNGGEYKKYFGNDIFVVDWTAEAKEFYGSHGGLVNKKFWNKEGITWNLITSSNPGFKIKENESLYSSGSPTIFNEDFKIDYYTLGFLNSKVTQYLLRTINPTMNTTVGDVLSLPNKPTTKEKRAKISNLVLSNVSIAKEDWDSIELSRRFKKHPLLNFESNSLQLSFKRWDQYTKERIERFKKNEEELNAFFISEYGLENELIPYIEEKDLTLSQANVGRDIKSFISYAVGCSFGRYSLDEEGLIYTGGGFDSTKYKIFQADEDNILPILPGAYYRDDIVSRLVDFVRITFGDELLNENLDFIADALGRKKGETAQETLRRYFLNDFSKDHVKTYNKRPIYWLFTSGKEKAFNCLIYMHRYDKTTLSRIRTDYLHDYQIRLDAEKKDLLNIIEGDSTAKEISNAKKELKSLDKKIEELKAYDELLHHMADMQIVIDLDDGVKVNYEKFKGLLAKI
ncbi:BREX-1 system adenine-specific DNA-methyltransferase PglX [Cytobacillus firmus]|uniref:BREX-1 system adenine-specific DNA-methyltransferase PglX n=1 Tax=Cytobacillus firmus TaxID=1399 RepID=UPI0018CD6E90|nr:BREX-1 system adenine-specific DNA-methyltransferase PglX [Cytobacillus firmus]MBG9589517.1 restriction endonuclease [Cytobacillus firmus]